MRFAIFSLLAILLVGCDPANKLQKAINRLNANPLEAARFCGDRFPPKEITVYRDSISLDTIYLEYTRTDTMVVNDTVRITITSPAKVITKTITKYKEVQVENTAKVQEKEKLYLACEDRYQKLYVKWELTEQSKKSWRSKFWWVLFVAIGAIIGYLTKQPFWATLLKQLQKQMKKK